MSEFEPEVTKTRIAGMTGPLLSPTRVGDLNRSRVIQALCDNGPLSRAHLAKMANVARATIGNIVQALIDADLIEEGDPHRASGQVGKPPRPLWFGPRAGMSGAAAISNGEVDAALVNARGDVLAEDKQRFDAATVRTDEIVKMVTGALKQVTRGASEEILGVGVSVPGVCDPATGEVRGSGQVPALEGFALATELSKSFDLVVIDTDTRAQALGERWFGKAKGVPSFASIMTGPGLGVGIVIDGLIVRGDQGSAGELGHAVVVPNGIECRCGLKGCWETVASSSWMREQARAAGLDDVVDAARLVQASTGSAEAADLLERYAENLSLGLATLTQLFGPLLFILHGDAVTGGEPFKERILRYTRDRIHVQHRNALRIELSTLDLRAAMLGAAGLVMSAAFELRV